MRKIIPFLLILAAVSCRAVLANNDASESVGLNNKKIYNNTINHLDGPLKKLIETGTIASPCINNSATKSVAENANKPIQTLPTIPMASHRNLFKTFHDRFYQQQQQQQQNYDLSVQQPQQYAHQLQQVAATTGASANDPEPKFPFFYYFFTKRPFGQIPQSIFSDGNNAGAPGQVPTIAASQQPIASTTSTTTTAKSTTVSVAGSSGDLQSGAHPSVPLTANNFFNPFFHHQPVRYEPTMKFVLGVPMSTLDNSFQADQLKNYYNRVQIDPHAYFPKPMRPRYMPVAAPYQPLYHMIRAVVLPDDMNSLEQKTPSQNSFEKFS